MTRRDFLMTAGPVAMMPGVAFAQRGQLPRIAVLSIPIGPPQWDAIVGGLADAGYVDGKTMALGRFTAPTYDDLPTFVARALATQPDVLMTVGSTTTLVAKSLTSTTPIVFQSNTPVELGVVASLAHPGGNATGVSNTSPDIVGKQLGILKEALPSLRRVAVLNLPRAAGVPLGTEAVRATAPVIGIEPSVVDFIEGNDFAEQFQPVLTSGAEVVYVPQSAYFDANGGLLSDLQLKTRLPQFWGAVSQPYRGVLAYAVNSAAQYRRMGEILDAILKGGKPADIPVEQPTVYDFVVNLKIAKAIGVTIPPSILAQATMVVQ